jgi:hypothetical protein
VTAHDSLNLTHRIITGLSNSFLKIERLVTHMFKKIISSVLIAGQLGFAGSAMASSAASSDVSPELTLISRTIALTGQNPSQPELQTQFSQLLADYEKSAQPDGQTERMEQALVELNIYTADQAHQLTLEASTAQVNSAQAAANEMKQLATKYPAGAQFSACTTGKILAAVGPIVGIVGAAIWAMGTDDGTTSSGGEHRDPNEVHNGQVTVMIGGGIRLHKHSERN